MNVGMIRSRALFVGLCAAAVVGGGGTPLAAEEREMITANPREANPFSVPGLPSCATVSLLRGDPRKEASVVLLKLKGGCRVPWHWHSANEEILIITGAGELDMKDGKPLSFQPGAYASLPSHHVHQVRCFTACVFASIADGAFDIHYVDAAGNEISMDQGLKAAVRKAKKRKK